MEANNVGGCPCATSESNAVKPGRANNFKSEARSSGPNAPDTCKYLDSLVDRRFSQAYCKDTGEYFTTYGNIVHYGLWDTVLGGNRNSSLGGRNSSFSRGASRNSGISLSPFGIWMLIGQESLSMFSDCDRRLRISSVSLHVPAEIAISIRYAPRGLNGRRIGVPSLPRLVRRITHS